MAVLVRNLQRAVKLDNVLLRKQIKALRSSFLDGKYADYDVAFTLTTDTRMRALNFEYRRVGATTDVLTFRLADPPPPPRAARGEEELEDGHGGLPEMPGRLLPGVEVLCAETGARLEPPEQLDGSGWLLPRDLGDVFVNVEYCARVASSNRLPLRYYLPVVCAHGLAHLVGLKHDDESEYREMQDAERKALLHLRTNTNLFAAPGNLAPEQERELQSYLQ